MSDEEIQEDHYRDKYGRWQKERRGGRDRRRDGQPPEGHERRKIFRRKVDREFYEKSHREMIEEALEDFAAEHDGRL
ncbi:MAG TPA: hypothetical protein HPP77_03770 [Candidatus Hydrogenedentes bacterium]|nr:hypothetical protein [Candidatus Hydrogenedentota bacterium]HIJ73985.1 hypothetical protein [Candidatus Hydrogenedentota bacterium]